MIVGLNGITLTRLVREGCTYIIDDVVLKDSFYELKAFSFCNIKP